MRGDNKANAQLLVRMGYPPGRVPRREDPSRTTHTPVNTLHQTHETDKRYPHHLVWKLVTHNTVRTTTRSSACFYGLDLMATIEGPELIT